MWDWIKSNYEGVVAVLAFFVAVWEARATRAHNKLSVLPHFDTDIALGDDNGTNSWISFSLTNNGLGPGRIISIAVFSNGARRSEASTHAAIKTASNEILKGILPTHIYIGGPEPGVVLPAGKSLTLIKWTFSKSSNLSVLDMENYLRKIEFVVEYESLYKQRMPTLPVKSNGSRI